MPTARYINSTGIVNVDLGNVTGPVTTGFLLDNTTALWSMPWYQNGTGFSDFAVYQGGSSYGTQTGINPGPFDVPQINFAFAPYGTLVGNNTVSNFKLVNAIPEPSTYALVVCGLLAGVIMLRRRRMASV